MTTFRAIGAGVVLVLALYFVCLNWWGVIASQINKRRGIAKHHSTVPLISLILAGIFAYPLYPFDPKWWIGLIPALDIGNWILIIGLPWAIVTGAFKKGPPNQASDATSEPAPGADSSAHQG